jgi:AcrR family transcriptional regulator
MRRKTYHHGDLKNALIKAGIEILAKEGTGSLSLREVASRAGVSHSAPYAHFADKQALIAAISTEGYRRIFESIEAATAPFADDPRRQLLEAAWAYLQFAMDETDHFRIALSGAVEQEKNYPALVEASQAGFSAIIQMVEACQAKGILAEGPADAVAVSVWSLVHGLASLIVEGQIPHSLLDRMSVRDLLIFSLNQIKGMELPDEALPTRSHT